MPFASTTLGSEQPLIASELLGQGRDPLAPIKDAVSPARMCTAVLVNTVVSY
ncbi:hypothetical protein MASR2M74_21790 [Paracoccaceae bacterium]